MKPNDLRFPKWATLCIVSFLCASCMAVIDSSAIDTDPSGWRNDQPCTLEWHNEDTLAKKELSLFLRYDNRLFCRSIPIRLQIVIQAPDSSSLTETVIFFPPEASETTPANTIHETSRKCREQINLEQKGTYLFTLVPQEQKPLQGVWAAGISLKNNSK